MDSDSLTPAAKPAILPLRKYDAQDLKLSELITQEQPVRFSVAMSAARWFSSFCTCFQSHELALGQLCTEGVLLPPQTAPGKKTLVLDLDETLVHSGFCQEMKSDVAIQVELDGKEVMVYANVRPGTEEFLARTSELYEVVVFTASLAKYANPLLDKIDVHSHISGRLFRESCLLQGGTYIKDLSRLGRDLKNVLIIDNSPASYELHQNNAIPISSWFDDPNDRELLSLLPVLETLADVPDVTQSIAQTREEVNKEKHKPRKPEPMILDTPTSQDGLENRSFSMPKHRYRRRSLGFDRGDYNSPVSVPEKKFDFGTVEQPLN